MAEFVQGKGAHECASAGVSFHCYLDHWVLSAVFKTGTAMAFCFRLVSGARCGIPQSPLICCQICMNVTELRPPNDANVFCEGRGYNEPVGLLKPCRVSVAIKRFTTYIALVLHIPLLYKMHLALYKYH